MRCDLLSNLYLWTIGNNGGCGASKPCWVVIYFQICIFEPLETTKGKSDSNFNMLWFTFKFVSLNHWKQPGYNELMIPICCDLLSNLYLWTIGNNFLNGAHTKICVVIYFQICIFEPLETTANYEYVAWYMLWFTFKFVSLNHWKQPVSRNCPA